jgi:hypothetical protein
LPVEHAHSMANWASSRLDVDQQLFR